ncbi:hypothetical protein [Streptomyces albireticuli]|uniref:Uncharacterized protein n=1 Tax=Streptomyces albireticuli TaxID=1940 RepID=A0A2A2D0X3_9ACTN|nr:hypothetical protein [Streptomyces albireticuli]MCD9196197.1 hypothetical protein [Streptomyces albireticuli]PAU44982.1 hypothetical protein CK936_31890 [Streptomyces albireticuli]
MDRLPDRADRRQTEAVPVNLAEHADNTGITRADTLSAGAFNIWGNTFPADELPAGGPVVVDGVPFLFPEAAPGRPDNIRCAGQLIEVPTGRYDWIQLLTAAERRTEDQVLLHYADGSVDPEWLRVPDFWPETGSRVGGSPAFTCTRMHYPRHVERKMGPVIWRHRVPVPRESDLGALRLPDNPAVHVFAMTLLPGAPLEVAA